MIHTFSPRLGRCLAAVAALLAGALTPAVAQNAPSPSAAAILAASLHAMGGEARLRSLTAIEYTALGERAMVEQSERPSGPYYADVQRIHMIRDLANNRSRSETTHDAYAGGAWWLQQDPAPPQVSVINGQVATVVGGGKSYYAGGSPIQKDAEQFTFAPERLLLTAKAAGDLHALPDTELHGVRHHVLAFTHDGAPCTLTINADTNLPWQITWTAAYPKQIFYNVWGDVTTSVTYNAWTLEPLGISYPREWTYERLGLPDTHFSIVRLALNPTIVASDLTVPADIVAANPHPMDADDYPLGAGGAAAHELAPGILEIPGGWNVAVVKQSDGIVVLEAPWSAPYSKRAFAKARETYPGLPIKAVITTSDSWPHLAGVRQAVAEKIPVIALDLNQPILERLLAAPHTMHPDDLARSPQTASFTFVGKPLAVGSGPNRLTVIPYRTATGERQMMVWFPEQHLLYTSDLFAPQGDGTWFTPQYLREAIGAINREHLTPKTVFGMHYDATPYQILLDADKKFAPPATP